MISCYRARNSNVSSSFDWRGICVWFPGFASISSDAAAGVHLRLEPSHDQLQSRVRIKPAPETRICTAIKPVWSTLAGTKRLPWSHDGFVSTQTLLFHLCAASLRLQQLSRNLPQLLIYCFCAASREQTRLRGNCVCERLVLWPDEPLILHL